MKVTLTHRLGQNPEGAVVDVSATEGDWLLSLGHAEETEQDHSSSSLADLKARAEALGVSSSGTKTQIVARITAKEQGVPEF